MIIIYHLTSFIVARILCIIHYSFSLLLYFNVLNYFAIYHFNYSLFIYVSIYLYCLLCVVINYH